VARAEAIVPGDAEAAPAKVNLFLHVLGRAPGGYHRLDSLAAFGPAFDVLHAEPADALSLEVVGPFAAGLGGDNLVLRAARALAVAAGVTPKARLVLDKQLPVASGIGGGSADAAAALRLLCRSWALDPASLWDVAAGLGADVPVCIGSQPSRMGGIGELLTPVPALPQVGVLLVNAGVPVATAEVFRRFAGPFSPPAELLDAFPTADALVDALRMTRNDLEAPAVQLCPVIADVLDALRALPGCRLARMSGSGGTCFALFDTPNSAILAASSLRDVWWRSSGALWNAASLPLASPPPGGGKGLG